VELLPPRILVEDLIIQGPGIPISVSLSSVDTYQISFLKNIKGPVAVALPPNDGTAKQGDRLVVVYLSTAAPAGSDYAVTVSTANSGLPEAVVLYLKESAEFVFDGTAWQVASATQSSDWQASSGPPGIVQNFNRSSPAGNTFQLYRENDPFSQPIFLKDVVYEDDTNLPPLPVSLESYLNSRIVQADWNETNSTQPDFIKNKPAIPDAGFTIAMALAL
jgi:hypothetical protein